MPSRDLPERTDILVIGGGIAGASAGAELAREADVVLLEAETQPGYHTTGRSAAFYAESYGGPALRPLTSASKDFFLSPPDDFAEGPLLSTRGCLHVFGPEGRDDALAEVETLARRIDGVRLIERDEALARVPVLRAGPVAGAIDDPECRDMDVAAIHQGYLRALRRRGGDVISRAPVKALERGSGVWRVRTPLGEIAAEMVVDAAGAWADIVAGMVGLAPLGFTPMRRTVILFHPRAAAVDDAWPLVMDFRERFYFKPETGRILASPADETPSPPCDVQPEEIDVALVVDRILQATRLDVPRIESKWAGLRTFAPDRVPVLGPDPRAPGFVWCAGQGGYGIQTAPAVARLTAALALGRPVPEDLRRHGAEAGLYRPDRLLAAAAPA